MNKEDLKNTEKNYTEAILTLLQNNISFKDKFLIFAPDISSEIESASVNNNCSCRNKIISFIDENKEQFNDFLYDFLIKSDLFVYFIEILNSIPVYTRYSGRIAKTSISEWHNFSEKLKKDNATFSSFSVIKDGEDILVFFL